MRLTNCSHPAAYERASHVTAHHNTEWKARHATGPALFLFANLSGTIEGIEIAAVAERSDEIQPDV